VDTVIYSNRQPVAASLPADSRPAAPKTSGHPAGRSTGSCRVLMIAPTSFFADYGCHVRILEEAQILGRLGHRVTIVTYHNGNPVPDLDIRRTMPVPGRRHYEVGSSRHKIVFDALLGLMTVQLLAGNRYDVIHTHLHEGALIGLVLGRLFRVPVVFDFQGSMTSEMVDHHFLKPGSTSHSTLLKLETWIDRSAPVILTSTAYTARMLTDEFGCRPEQVRSLPDCVNSEIFKPVSQHHPAEIAALRDRLGIPAGRKLIVYLGLLAEYQGTSILLEAMRRLVEDHPDAHLLLMGFPSVDFYRQRAGELGIGDHVTLTGRVPYAEAPLHLALGDVAVAPKLSLTEGSGKLLNYMALGLPVVAFDTPVAREYLGADGLLARPGDAESLAACLAQCLFPSAGASDPIVSMGARLRQRAVQYFSWEAAGRQIVETYRELLGDAVSARIPGASPVVSAVPRFGRDGK
jgi:glycosyltransferase involved in cell wall biosynthesis